MGMVRYYSGRVVRDFLPAGLTRRVMQTRRAFASWRKQRREQNRSRLHGELRVDELYDSLLAAGVKPGGVLLVHSSFGEFTNFKGSAGDVLEVLERLVGPSGTLMMPAQYVSKKDQFNVVRHPASVGLLCEMFRRREGTVRSSHPGQSVCANGPLAEELVADHHQHPLGCGPRSPFAKLLHHNGQVLGLGLPPLWTTFLHVVEDLEPEQFPWRMYAQETRTFTVVDAMGSTNEVTIPLRDEKMLARIDPRSLASHVSERGHRSFQVKGIPCFLADCIPLFAELKSLSQRGITAYGRAPRRSA